VILDIGRLGFPCFLRDSQSRVPEGATYHLVLGGGAADFGHNAHLSVQMRAAQAGIQFDTDPVLAKSVQYPSPPCETTGAKGVGTPGAPQERPRVASLRAQAHAYIVNLCMCAGICVARFLDERLQM